MNNQEKYYMIESRKENPTISEVLDGGDRYCEAWGINPWCLNEGLASGDEILNTHERLCELEDEILRDKPTNYLLTMYGNIALDGNELRPFGLGNKPLKKVLRDWADANPDKLREWIFAFIIDDVEII